MDSKGASIMARLRNYVQDKPWQFFSIMLCIILVSASIYATFEKNSAVTRTYFIDEFKRTNANDFDARIEKPAIVAPTTTELITAKADEIESITVQIGAAVSASEELAIYQGTEVDDVRARLEKERSAYQRELSDLQSALATIERDLRSAKRPSSNIKTEQKEKDLNVNVQLDLAQSESPATAKAIIEGNIAQANRQISIVDAQIAELQARQSVSSPVDGIVADITESGGYVTFTIFSNERHLRTYVTEKDWRKIEANDMAELTINNDEVADEEQSEALKAALAKHRAKMEIEAPDTSLTGTVAQKLLLPADLTNLWTANYNLLHPLAKKEAYYEVMITPDQTIEEAPFAADGHVAIITDEATNANKVDSDWIVETIERDEEDETAEPYAVDNIYYVDYDGKVRLEAVDVAFEDKDKTVFTSILDDGTPMLNAKKREPLARTFRTMPFTLDKKQWRAFKKLKWKDYVIYSVSGQ